MGLITIDDVVDVIREEAEHSVLTMAGLDEEADMFAPVADSARRRWVWLGVNLITALLAAMVLYSFEATLDQIVATAVLFPIVMSMGGIAGTQTLTLMIRGMATGQVNARNTREMFRKELAVGVLNGLVFSVLIARHRLALVRRCAAGHGDGRRHSAQPGGRRALPGSSCRWCSSACRLIRRWPAAWC